MTRTRRYTPPPRSQEVEVCRGGRLRVKTRVSGRKYKLACGGEQQEKF